MITHLFKNPFPAKIKLGTVLNERCHCEHLRSEHADSTGAFGHGPCTECSCRKFTWKTFILQQGPVTRGKR